MNLENISIEQIEAADKSMMSAFAANYAFGVPLVRSMKLAGYENPTKDQAFRLLGYAFVKEQLELNFALLRQALMQSREQIIAQLDEDRAFAYEESNPAAAIAATVGKAKILGLMDATNKANMPSKIEISWGEESKETVYEKSNPLLFDALAATVGNG